MIGREREEEEEEKNKCHFTIYVFTTSSFYTSYTAALFCHTGMGCVLSYESEGFIVLFRSITGNNGILSSTARSGAAPPLSCLHDYQVCSPLLTHIFVGRSQLLLDGLVIHLRAYQHNCMARSFLLSSPCSCVLVFCTCSYYLRIYVHFNN